MATEILLPLHRDVEQSLRTQLERQFRLAIQTGRIGLSSRLPSTRCLADELGISRGVVVAAYEQLAAEGYICSASGSGTRVAAVRGRAVPDSVVEPRVASPQFDFRPGIPDVTRFPQQAWIACMRRGLKLAGPQVLSYPDPRGPLATRAALAAYLARSRATVGGADRIVMCTGFAQGSELVARLLRRLGVKHVAIEDPGFGQLWSRLRAMGFAVHPIPVDDAGMSLEALARSPATAVFVTPCHHFPTGAGMPGGRRVGLLKWAEDNHAVVVEDDYDAEYRYDREPLGALQGLASERVIYMGTGSKILSPALRLGWLLAPSAWVELLVDLKRTVDGGSSVMDHLALAQFVAEGLLDRHLRQMRVIYRDRRDRMVDAIGEFLPGLRISGVAAGLHLMIDLPSLIDEASLVASARRQSISLAGGATFAIRSEPSHPRLVIGYGGASDGSIRTGVRRLANLISGAAS